MATAVLTALPEFTWSFRSRNLTSALRGAKAELGSRLVILGHHYQRDEVVKFADYRGDSLRLSQLAARRPEAEYIVFCGVHFMAESADILSGDHQMVILPDLNAGCSMADMAEPRASGGLLGGTEQRPPAARLCPLPTSTPLRPSRLLWGGTAAPCAPPRTPAS